MIAFTLKQISYNRNKVNGELQVMDQSPIALASALKHDYKFLPSSSQKPFFTKISMTCFAILPLEPRIIMFFIFK
jgi:hypothetical protein